MRSAKCATHAESEFNLATPKELFSYCKAIISLSGTAVCGLLQFRRSNDGSGHGDDSRVQMAQQVLKNFLEQKLNKKFIKKFPEIFEKLTESIETNYPVSKLADDIRLMDNLKSGITFKTLSGTSLTDDTGFVIYKEETDGVKTETVRKNVTRTAKASANEMEWEGFIMPCEGEIANHFGKRIHPVTNEIKEHNGIDIKADEGTSVVSSISGIVTDVGYDTEKGHYIVVERDNIKTTYCQLSAANVEKGDSITAKQTIGAVGSTGNSTGAHLHFEVMVEDAYVDPEKLIQK